MAHPAHIDLAARLVADLDNDEPVMLEAERRISVDRYTCTKRYEAELERIFRRFPLIAAHSTELAGPGATTTFDAVGVPIILTRGHDGRVRGFLNACRHRATRLVNQSRCTKKALVCPYHGWTYDLDGALRHIPHERAFCSVDREERGLVQVPVEEAHGFVWVTARRLDAGDPFGLAEHLGPVGDELDAFALGSHIVYQHTSTVRKANWKLAIDAFLEAYHIRVLHRKSIYPFFHDSRAISDPVGRHLRSAATRRKADEVRGLDLRGVDLRQYVTPTYFLFPHTILIAHPDFVSVVCVYPEAADELRWVHRLLIPEEPADEQAAEHWRRSFELIEGGVFQGEDLETAERMQLGLRTGADHEVVFGKLEASLGWFHDRIDDALAD